MKHVKHFEAFEVRENDSEIYQDNLQISPVKKDYHINCWGQYNESLAGMSTNINQAIKNASELVGKDLDNKNVIPELRDKIENLLQQGDTDLADELTDLKKQIENNEN